MAPSRDRHGICAAYADCSDLQLAAQRRLYLVRICGGCLAVGVYLSGITRMVRQSQSGFAAAGAYVWYIAWMTAGGWFWTFALPVIGGICLIVTAVITLQKYVKKGILYIYGGALMAFGVLMLGMEHLLVVTFDAISFIGWSLYPLAVFFVLGGLLIFLAICRPARDMMERKTFL